LSHHDAARSLQVPSGAIPSTAPDPRAGCGPSSRSLCIGSIVPVGLGSMRLVPVGRQTSASLVLWPRCARQTGRQRGECRHTGHMSQVTVIQKCRHKQIEMIVQAPTSQSFRSAGTQGTVMQQFRHTGHSHTEVQAHVRVVMPDLLYYIY
jgi:hypothetical protein